MSTEELKELLRETSPIVNGNSPVYPHLDAGCQRVNETEHFPGLSKREYFAAMAMQAIIGKSPYQYWSPSQYDKADEKELCIVRGAVAYADKLLAELAKEPTP